MEIDWRVYSKMPMPDFGIVTVMFERVRWLSEGAVTIDNGVGFQSLIVQLSPDEAERFEIGKTYRATFG